MTTRELLLSAWNWNFVPLLFCLMAVVAYAIACRGRLSGKPIVLVAALVVFLLAMASPVNTLAEGYLFSAHMLQHILLLLVAPLFLLLSLPVTAGPTLNSSSLAARIGRMATFPGVTWLAGVGAMWLWHAPTLCNAATANPVVRDAQIVSLLAMGALFWWPVAGPFRHQRLSPLAGMAYLFSACVACTLLGIFITFTPLAVCSIYRHPVDRLGILPLLRNGWGLTPKVDQQIGGLLMWVPSCLIYLGAIMGLLARWYRDPEFETEGAIVSPKESLDAAPASFRAPIQFQKK